MTVNLANTGTQSTGGAGTDTLTSIENVTGSAFNDTLTGNTGNNVIIGGAGNDTMNGAAGTDTVDYSTATAGVTVNLAVTAAQNTGGAGTDTLSNFENLTGSAFNDILTGNAGNNIIVGGAGNDTINGGAGNDTFVFRTGFGTDTITGFGDAAGNEDVIAFDSAVFSSFAQIEAAMQQVGANVTITEPDRHDHVDQRHARQYRPDRLPFPLRAGGGIAAAARPRQPSGNPSARIIHIRSAAIAGTDLSVRVALFCERGTQMRSIGEWSKQKFALARLLPIVP